MTEFGVGTYIRNVVRTLARLITTATISSWIAGEGGGIWRLPPNFHLEVLVGSDDTLKGTLDFRAIVRRLQCDVVHIPHLFWIPRD